MCEKEKKDTSDGEFCLFVSRAEYLSPKYARLNM